MTTFRGNAVLNSNSKTFQPEGSAEPGSTLREFVPGQTWTETTNFKEFIPGQSFVPATNNKNFSEFIPGKDFQEFVPGKDFKEFVPGTEFVPGDYQEFVPGQEFVPDEAFSLAKGFTEFVPGQEFVPGAQFVTDAEYTDENLQEFPWVQENAACPCCTGYIFNCCGEECIQQGQCLCSVSIDGQSLVYDGSEVSMPFTPPPPPGPPPVQDEEGWTISKNGVRRYKPEWLRRSRNRPECNRPTEVPRKIKRKVDLFQYGSNSEEKRYDYEFFKQFENQKCCQVLPENHNIPASLRGPKIHDMKKMVCILPSGEVDDQKLVRKMNGLLNKLTVDKFEKLYIALLELGISKQTHVQNLIEMIFLKAVTQHHYIQMYANLCSRLDQWLNTTSICENRKTFKCILLNQCQESFLKYLRQPAHLDDLQGDELYEAQVKYKTKMLGNVKLVGQLLIRKMVSSQVILMCIEELLENQNEETLETLVSFLTEVGPRFDDNLWKRHKKFEPVFDKLQQMIDEQIWSNRIRCLMQDLLDLRAKKWDDGKDVGPTTIAEVYKEWVAEDAPMRRKVISPSKNINKGLGATHTRAACSSKKKPEKTLARYVPIDPTRSAQHGTRWRKKAQTADAVQITEASTESDNKCTIVTESEPEESTMHAFLSESEPGDCSDPEEQPMQCIPEVPAAPATAEALVHHICELAEGVRRQVKSLPELGLSKDFLIQGLDLFISEIYDDLKVDVPLLPGIFSDIIATVESQIGPEVSDRMRASIA